MSPFLRLAYEAFANRGLEVRRHHATRRQRVLARRGVDVVVDVGAATGEYATELRKFGYRGRIVSFEPREAAFDALRAEATGDDAWEVHPYALGRTTGTTEINVASNGASSSLLPMLEAHVAAAPSVTMTGVETIRVERLDEVIGTQIRDARAPFLKIDTQGFEREVLAGAPDSLPHFVGLQLELSFIPLYDGGMLVDEAVSWAYDNGFRLVGMEQGYAAPTGELLQCDGVFMRP